METNNKFFVYDSYVFAFKNFLAQIRIFVIASLVWIAGFIPFFAITVYINRGSLFASPFSLTGAIATWKALPTAGATHWLTILHSHVTTSSIGLALFSMFIIPLFVLWISIGVVRIALKINKGEKVGIQDLFSSPLLLAKCLIAVFCLGLIALIGCIFFIIPGIYWMIRTYFVIFALVEGEGIFESFATSFRITRNKGWYLFGVFCMNFALVRLSMLFYFIPILSIAYLYRYLKAENK